MRLRSLLTCLLVLAVVAPSAVAAQSGLIGADPGSSVRTRAELERLLEEYQQALGSPAYSESVKRTIRDDAERISSRLQNGDFRVGDRIVLDVQGEPNLPDTLVVEPGPRVTLPLFGEVPLAGVLRSEITTHLTEALRRLILDPVVRANGLMRLAVIGQVVRPGFYTMPAEMLVGEALMVAGGPTTVAELGELRIERGTLVLLEGVALQEAMRSGLTLDQLNLQAGDQIVIPAGSTGSTLSTIAVLAGIVGSISGLVVILFLR